MCGLLQREELGALKNWKDYDGLRQRRVGGVSLVRKAGPRHECGGMGVVC